MIFANASMKSTKENFLAIIDSNKVVKLESLMKSCPKDMISFIEKYNSKLQEEIHKILKDKNIPTIAREDIVLLSPIPYPRRNVFCLGKNYIEHANEIKSIPGGDNMVPKEPIYFTKLAYPCMGPEDIILSHKSFTNQLDYEVELTIIIGKKGTNIVKEEAEDYIFGYTIGNDFSVRDIQKKHIQWFKGKSMDTCCSIGPYIVSKEDIPFPPSLDISCSINGEVRQNSNTSKLIFDIPTIIHDLSKGLTLYPGDIIMTGTPAGVGLGFDPPRTLEAGDVVECKIEKIGTLRNYIEK
ncbi:2-keto-4-pentenoate hydratase/2-oxohepta-3-ene-1,7-dioic acid hydratase in catechol pathway [Alkalibaculum bacchi]|jgi:2-keto-4-pentenoate hydratase/2-oxohepta-3-ene-1,7-dioic acid hydratase in catechol pathway|uniref:2-keto-4-pentenoate hydratase/2-oxohepta-3-ene-1,7-dioic acid hydratase in catechol pathway n=1 Tax=Alkalibaculum bacchi TaxID=645887 RepID=A0A366I031_9FIRM|nr:fumarylacetoacetate hydrolase family protein [Alkalibaculum bacchi]RBP58726.1 2-keto-4-pentenoate hydratase/2-oxohepta-3-ene-1,7-dioic acid hydratase in catechol pathway [Alkalibaculum bacchi]